MSSSVGFPAMVTKISWAAQKHARTSVGVMLNEKLRTPGADGGCGSCLKQKLISVFLIALTYDKEHHCRGKRYVNRL